MDIICMGGKVSPRDPLYQSDEYWEYLEYRCDYAVGRIDGRLKVGKCWVENTEGER